jgi:hypothetical protein
MLAFWHVSQVLKETYSIEQVLPAYERVGEGQRVAESEMPKSTNFDVVLA